MAEKNLAQQMRERLNKRAGKRITIETTKTEDLVQVEAWIEMPAYFQRAVGAKGIPVGHITQVIGKSDTGKTTLVMTAMISTQRNGGLVYLVDSEHKFSFERFRLMGGVPEDLIVMPVDSLEDAWNAFETVNADIADLRKSDGNTPVLCVWDSIAASVPDAILEAEAEDQHVSVEAKINNKEIRKLRKRVRDNKIAILAINHSYFSMPRFGIAEEIIKGGTELFYSATLILKTKRRAWLKRTVNEIDEKFGVHSLLEVFKGHLGGSKATTPFYIVGQGILSSEEELKEYKELIEEIEGPDINKLTMAQLREIHANKPKKEKASEAKKSKKSKKERDEEEAEETE